jgi:hypothetical protein
VLCVCVCVVGAFDSADIVISANLTDQDTDRHVYTFKILKVKSRDGRCFAAKLNLFFGCYANVAQVIKGSKDNIRWTAAALTNKTIQARPVNIRRYLVCCVVVVAPIQECCALANVSANSGCATTWRYRQPTEGLVIHTHIYVYTYILMIVMMHRCRNM